VAATLKDSFILSLSNISADPGIITVITYFVVAPDVAAARFQEIPESEPSLSSRFKGPRSRLIISSKTTKNLSLSAQSLS